MVRAPDDGGEGEEVGLEMIWKGLPSSGEYSTTHRTGLRKYNRSILSAIFAGLFFISALLSAKTECVKELLRRLLAKWCLPAILLPSCAQLPIALHFLVLQLAVKATSFLWISQHQLCSELD